uniref:Uncharacterized protein n=1 Tax=Setaria italica TaxID=4555 RepID=K3ZFW8_SETIT
MCFRPSQQLSLLSWPKKKSYLLPLPLFPSCCHHQALPMFRTS